MTDKSPSAPEQLYPPAPQMSTIPAPITNFTNIINNAMSNQQVQELKNTVVAKAKELVDQGFHMLADETTEVSKDLVAWQAEQMLKKCKYQRKDWTPDEIEAEISKQIKEKDKNYIYVKDTHLDAKEIDQLLYKTVDGKKIRTRYVITDANKDNVIEELYPDMKTQAKVCCFNTCNFKMNDLNVKGIENLKISWV